MTVYSIHKKILRVGKTQFNSFKPQKSKKCHCVEINVVCVTKSLGKEIEEEVALHLEQV